MAKFCSNCGNEVHENAVVCIKCGCAIPQMDASKQHMTQNKKSVLDVISQRIQINGIIWLAVGALQIILGILDVRENWFLLLVGAINLVYGFADLKYSKDCLVRPIGIVKQAKPLVRTVIVLVYNLLIGAIIGVAGSIYYLVAVRAYILENERAFLEIEQQRSGVDSQQ